MAEHLKGVATKLSPDAEIYQPASMGCEDTGQPGAYLEMHDPSWETRRDVDAALANAKWFPRERGEFLKPTGDVRANSQAKSPDEFLDGPVLRLSTN